MKTFTIETKESACLHSLLLSLHIWYSPSRMYYVSRLLSMANINNNEAIETNEAEITMSNSKRTPSFMLFIETLPTLTENTTIFNCREYVCVHGLIHVVPNLSLYLQYNTFLYVLPPTHEDLYTSLPLNPLGVFHITDLVWPRK